MNEEFEVDFNEASDNEPKLFRDISHTDEKSITIENNIAITDALRNAISNKKNSYFIIKYEKRKYDEVKNMLTDKIVKLNKVDYNELQYSKVLEESKNVYFLFLDSERKLIKAYMKKDYINSDKNIKLETKTK
jgi:hypothetical protein